MDNTREKLIELIGSTEYGNGSLIGNNFQKGFIEKIADHLIANGVILDYQVSSSKWISVKDRLPEPFVDVIAFFGGQEMYVDSVDNKGRWYSSYMYMCDPTYWMPLPQPPKGE